MKEKLQQFFKAIQTKQIGILVTIMMGFLTLVMLSWLYAFWSNGLNGTHFELGSCWQGISAVVAGMTGIAALAGSKYASYYLDSKYNSEEGVKPERK